VYKKKTIILILTLLSAIFIAIILNINHFRDISKKILPYEFKILVKNFILGEDFFNQINSLKVSNYNQKNLPESEFIKLDFKKKEIKKIKKAGLSHYNILQNNKSDLKKKFFIEIVNDEIFILDSTGSILKIKDFEKLEEIEVKNNIKNLNSLDIKDIHFLNGKIYITYSYKKSKDCNFLRIAESNLENLFLNFKIFYSSEECHRNVIAGKMATYTHNGKKGLLLTTGSDGKEKKKYAQLDGSFYGKILFFNIAEKKYQLISKGHRNPQGLFVYNEKIIATEHGPKGGDEINLITVGKNYGWPISSYGEPYSFKYKLNEKFIYKKDHSKYKFVEPIYSFVPSIGISQIIKVPENFSEFWKDNFLISSLNGRSLYRVKFDDKFEKILYKEKIIIGERIRDMVYFKKIDAILLALEDTGSIGFLKIPLIN